MSGSYAYVAAWISDSLVVVDISNPASPAIRGSVVSSSLLDWVRVTLSRGARMASIMLAPAVRPLPMPSRALTCSLSRAVHTGYSRRRERLLRLRGGVEFQLAGGDRH